MQQPVPTANQEWRSNWPLVLSSTVGLSLGTVMVASLGLFMQPLNREFGWSVTQISAGLTLTALIATPLAPFVGALVDKYGTRRIAVPGAALLGLALAAFSLLTPSLWHWFGAWTLYALMGLMVRNLVWTGAVSNSFVASRGLALAVVLCGTAIATSFAPIIARWIIDNHGWRMAYAALGLGWGGITFVLVALFFHDARSKTERAVRAGSGQPAAFRAGGLTLGEAAGDQRVIRIALAISLQSLIGAAAFVHLVPLLVTTGVTRAEAAGIAALLGAGSIVGKLVAGWLLDNFASVLVPFICFALPGVGYLLLLLGHATIPQLATAVFIVGCGSGSAFQVTTYLTTRYAGIRNFGKIFGTITALMGLAGGLGPLAAGIVFDATGNYTALMTIAAPAALIAGLAVLGLGPYPSYEAEPIATAS